MPDLGLRRLSLFSVRINHSPPLQEAERICQIS